MPDFNQLYDLQALIRLMPIGACIEVITPHEDEFPEVIVKQQDRINARRLDIKLSLELVHKLKDAELIELSCTTDYDPDLSACYDYYNINLEKI